MKKILHGCIVLMLITNIPAFAGSSSAEELQMSKKKIKLMPLISAASLLDWKLENRAAMELGNVADLLIDKNRNRIAYVTVNYDYGTVPLFKGTYFVLPWAEVSLNPESEKMVFNMYGEMYETGNRYFMGGAENITDYGGNYYIFFAREPAEAPVGPHGTYTSVGFQAKPGSAIAEMKKRTYNLTRLMARGVRDKQDNLAGNLKSVLIQPQNGRVVFGLVELDANNSYVPVPWPALQFKKGPEVFKVNVDLDTLTENSIQPGKEQKVKQLTTAEEIYSAFDVKPHWKGESKEGAAE